MNDQFSHWFCHHASGRDLAVRETAFFAAAAREMYGQAAVQLELDGLDTLLSATAVKRRIRAGRYQGDVCCDVHQLPFAAESIDALTLPHTLEVCGHPQQILHESYRVLKADGKLVITGFNPCSTWFFSRLWGRGVLPLRRHCIRLARLKDWLDLLGFDILTGQFMVYTPLLDHERHLQQLNFLNHAGSRWLPQYAAVYGLVAVKRVVPLRLVKPQWREQAATVQGWAVSANIAGQGESS